MKPLLLSAALLTLAAAGCGVKPIPVDEPVYAIERYDISIELPGDGWLAEDLRDMNAVLFQRAEEPGWIVLQVSSISGRETAAPEILSREMFVEFREKRVYGPPVEMIIGGKRAAAMDIGAKLEGRDVMIRACSLVHRDRIYDFVCWSLDDDFKDALDLFRRFLAGVRFSEVEGD